MVLSGCAALTRPGTPLYRIEQERKLARAATLLERKDVAAATGQLEAICAAPGVPGVTDEALFRLSMLNLVNGRNMAGQGKARKGLERLRKEYPSSSWAPIAAAVSEALATFDTSITSSRATEEEQRQQLRKLKEQISALSRENRELRESIEKLKNLEIEMGKGPKR
jgi:TolA-binding protein